MKTIAVTLFALSLIGCAGVRAGSPSQPFINQTMMPEATFQSTAQADWAQAQKILATQPINLAAGVYGVKTVAPDPRAYGVAPVNITVIGKADAPGHPGIITCDSVTGYCDAYLEDGHTIVVPASKPQYMGPYEMENIILMHLGYDVSER